MPKSRTQTRVARTCSIWCLLQSEGGKPLTGLHADLTVPSILSLYHQGHLESRHFLNYAEKHTGKMVFICIRECFVYVPLRIVDVCFPDWKVKLEFNKLIA